MGETIHRVEGLELCAEVRGPDDGVPLLLVMGPDAAADGTHREWNRVRNPAGVGRRIVAINASGSRTEALGGVEVPFTVIHGTADTLATPTGGTRTAETVRHAVHVEIEGMGHNLPRALWPQIMDEIDATVERTRDVDPTLHTD